jgi:hypothetical protein
LGVAIGYRSSALHCNCPGHEVVDIGIDASAVRSFEEKVGIGQHPRITIMTETELHIIT